MNHKDREINTKKSYAKISVVIPVYNGGVFFRKVLNEVCNQSYDNLEIIIVNDKSDDNTIDIINEYAEKDSRIIVVNNKERIGAGASRNVGIKCITGEYTIFLDADDSFEQNMIESMYQKIYKDDLDMAVCKCDYLYKINNKDLYIPYHYSINDPIVVKNDVCKISDIKENIFNVFSGWTWDKLLKTEIFMKNNIRFKEIRSSNDLTFVYSYLVKCEKIGIVDKVLVHHTKAKGTISTTRESSWECFCEALLGLKEFLVKNKLYDRYEKDFINYALHFSLWNLNSVEDTTKIVMQKKLIDKWFKEFGILGKSKEFFYNKLEYEEIKKILNNEKSGSLLTRYFLKSLERIRKFGIINAVIENMADYFLYLFKNIKFLLKGEKNE